jgi:hypothetical protein
VLDTIEMRKWAESQYDILGGTAYARVNQLLTEVERLRDERAVRQAAMRRVAAELTVLGVAA